MKPVSTPAWLNFCVRLYPNCTGRLASMSIFFLAVFFAFFAFVSDTLIWSSRKVDSTLSNCINERRTHPRRPKSETTTEITYNGMHRVRTWTYLEANVEHCEGLVWDYIQLCLGAHNPSCTNITHSFPSSPCFIYSSDSSSTDPEVLTFWSNPTFRLLKLIYPRCSSRELDTPEP